MSPLPECRESAAHQLPAMALDQAGRLARFNWMLAAYAHDDWLGDWAVSLRPREAVAERVLHSASAALLETHGLSHRHLRSVDEHDWLLWPQVQLAPVMQELGVAMLGGWVCGSLERDQVARQLQVLGPDRRATALNHAASLQALPFLNLDRCWPAARLEPRSVVELGVSCLAALLDDASTGARERFLMRFPEGMTMPIRLDDAARAEALALIHRQAASMSPGTSSVSKGNS